MMSFKSLHTRIADSVLRVADVASLPVGGDEGDIRWVDDQNAIYTYNGTTWASQAGTGDASGPASATDNALARFDGTTGKLLKNSAATLSDAGVISTAGALLTGLTASRAVVTDGSKNLASSGTSATELGYVTGVTSALQTQIDAKFASAGTLGADHGGTGVANNIAATLTRSGSHALTITTTGVTGVTLPTTGTLATLAGSEAFTSKTLTSPVINSPTGLVKADVGLGSVDNTADATKDAATATLTNKTLTSPKLNENVAVTTTATKLNYLTSATGTTGTASTNVVFSTSPTLITPILGTPQSGVLTSCTGLPMTTGVTGVLPIANGGTNKALTLVNGGVVWSDADSFEVSAVGTVGQRLKSNGVAAPSFGWNSTTAKNANYTITDTDGFDVILVTTGSGGDVTITLPTAADNTGRIITVKKVDSGTSGMVLDGEGSETIDGGLNTSAVAQYGYITVVCNGTGWNVLAANDYRESLVSNIGTAVGTTAQYKDAGSITLPPGEWDLSLFVYLDPNNAVITEFAAGIGLTTGNDAGGLVTANNFGWNSVLTGSQSRSHMTVPPWRTAITANTTYYGKIIANYTGNVPVYGSRLSARRTGR